MLFVALFSIFPMDASGRTCRERPAHGWQIQLTQWATAIAEGGLSPNLAENVAACREAIEKAGHSRCFENLSRFSETMNKVRRPGHGAGYTVPDRQYIDEINRRNPNLITLPPEFKNGLPPNWRDIVKDKGWKALEYRSWSIANPPYGHFSRVLIQIEKDGYDQWLQFTVPDKAGDTRGASLINVMGVEKRATDLKPSPGFSFAEYSLEPGGHSPKLKPFGYSCYSCHPSGARQVVPAPGSVPTHQLATLQDMNAAMRSYGDANFYRLEPKNLGPHLGKAGGCTGCHNGFNQPLIRTRSAMGALNVLAPPSLARFKMLVEFSMPPLIRMLEPGRAFLDARDKVDKLTDSQRAELVQRYASLPDTAHNSAILEFLRDKKILSQPEYTEAVKSLAFLSERQEKAMLEMEREDAKEIKTWLLGGRNDCVVPDRLRPATLGTPRRMSDSGAQR